MNQSTVFAEQQQQYSTFIFEGENTLYPPFSGAQLDQSDIDSWMTATENFFGEIDPFMFVSFTDAYPQDEESKLATNSLPIRYHLGVSYPAHMGTYEAKELVSIVFSAFDSYEKEAGYVLDQEQHEGYVVSDGEIQIDLVIYLPTLLLQAQHSGSNADVLITTVAMIAIILIAILITIKWRRHRGGKLHTAADRSPIGDEICFSLDEGSDLRLTSRRSAFASSRGKAQNQNFRISKNPTEMKMERIEAFFYNHGMEIALGVLYLAINILVACHGAYQFTAIGGWTTDDDLLRVTLPIARGGGRLVTLNCAIVLLTACKYLWTCVRMHVVPFLPIGFPIDNIMPKYHKVVARMAIVGGCVVHTLPQIANYATRSIAIEEPFRGWTFGNGFATKQLLWTGTLLAIIFSTFFLTTLQSFRRTTTGFRWFWFFHVGGIAAAYPLLLLHGTYRGHPVFLYSALLPLALYLFDIAMRRSKISTTKVLRWKTYEDEGQRITELVIECPENFVYTPGQYAELRFRPISSSEWHPFTIASAPNETGDDGGGPTQQLVFYIKSTGRWTDALYNYASAFDLSKASESVTIQVRGPHGAPAMNYFEYKHIVVIGSGVGVTPLLSIWKYLVARGRTMVYRKNKGDNSDGESSEFSLLSSQRDLLNETTRDFIDEDSVSMTSFRQSKHSVVTTPSRLRSSCIFLEKAFESMTVSMSLLVVFVLGETLTFVLQIFGYQVAANSMGMWLSLCALVTHGTTVLVSGVALGWSHYFQLLRCWLECTIIFVDAIALLYSLRNRDEVGVEASPTTRNRAYFVLFGAVVILHALRIFHIFYMTLKPKARAVMTDPAKSNTDQEICSIDGILINRMFSNMKFAARSLLRPIIEDGLSDLFSMEFYGTREKSKDGDRIEHGLISEMMGSGHGLDIGCSMCDDDYFHPGRPNWNQIFLKTIAKAHQSNPKGESVGVFFCGSPAIAKDLQAAAANITAQHQFAVKHLDGKPCRCKLIVHSENF